LILVKGHTHKLTVNQQLL